MPMAGLAPTGGAKSNPGFATTRTTLPASMHGVIKTKPSAPHSARLRQNRFRRIRINAIGIGVAGEARRLVETLAKENWGVSVIL